MKFLCVGILFKIENFAKKLKKSPTFEPIYLTLILYRNFAMFPTYGKQVQKSDEGLQK